MVLRFGYGADVDSWALRIVKYEMMVGWHPFLFPKGPPLAEKILKSTVLYPRRLNWCATSLLNGVGIFNTKTEALGVAYNFLNSVFFRTQKHYCH